VGRFERIGYVVWGSVALVVAIPEIWALAVNDAPWPTISGTTGHLEDLWHPTAVFVVALIVVAAALAVGYGRPGERTPTNAPAGQWWPFLYLGSAVVFTVGAGFLASSLVNGREGRFVLGYVIYGTIGFFFLFLPAVFGWAFVVPFPSLFTTLRDLERRVPLIALLVLAGLVILLIHLALYPWPDVTHHNPRPGSP
jgi:Na+/proline symporter